MDLRKRRGVNVTSTNSSYEQINEDKSRKHRDLLGYRYWLILAISVLFLHKSTDFFHRRLPDVLDGSNWNEFSEKRAREVLRNLTDLGPRPAGSKSLEIGAVNLLTAKLEEIKQTAARIGKNRVETTVQRPTGCFELFPQSFTLCYNKVTNVVARVGPAGGPAKHSLLLNCHYDTVIDSPGANDDATACAVMIDVIDVLAHSPEKIDFDVVFLFNGAEEYGLQAAHGFIETHPWRHTIRAFINLESCGSGGREVLFQSGPGNSWLLQTYIENAPYPFCTVLGQELFSAGAVPSDTDFRIFRDHGRISGLDLAYIKNGWVYHTEFDEEWRIDAGSLQRNGANVLAVVKAILRSPYFSQPASFEESNRWVYYDVVGLFSIHYPVYIGQILNFGSCVLVLLLVAFRIYKGVYSATDVVLGIVRVSVAFICMTGTSMLMIQVVNRFDVGMSWYKNPERLYPMYAFPIMLVGLSVHALFKNAKERLDLERAQYDCILITYGFCLFILSWLNVMSACFVLIHVVVFLLKDFIVIFLHATGIVKEKTVGLNFWVQLLCVTPLVVFSFYMMGQLFETFVPILGRAGTRRNPELVMASVGLIIASNFVLFLHNLVYVSKRMNKLLLAILGLIVVYFVLLHTTTMRIPYEYSQENPKLRRILAMHTNRTILDKSGEVVQRDNALFIQSLDYRNTADLPSHPLLDGAPPNCTGVADIYCHLPYYNNIHKNFPTSQVRWIPSEAPVPISNPMRMKLISKTKTANNKLNCSFELSGGSDKMSLHITPLHNHKLLSWSVSDVDMKKFGDKTTYFISFTSGSERPKTRPIWMLFEEEAENDSESVVELTAVSIYGHGEDQITEPITKLREVIKQKRVSEDTSDWKWRMTMIGAGAEVVSQPF